MSAKHLRNVPLKLLRFLIARDVLATELQAVMNIGKEGFVKTNNHSDACRSCSGVYYQDCLETTRFSKEDFLKLIYNIFFIKQLKISFVYTSLRIFQGTGN